MTIDFEVKVSIERPVPEVFLFLSDFSNMVRWNYFIQHVSKISSGNVGLGTVFEMKRPNDLYRYKITGFDPPHRIVVDLQPPGPGVQLIFTLNTDGQQTRLMYQWHVDLERYGLLKYIPGDWLKRLIIAIPRKILLTRTKPAVEENVGKLKELLETGKTILQDGRSMVLPSNVPTALDDH